jgi:lipopolysaccharide/colanic/teichoic acid biosynthesis glycosyltransferase
LNSPYLILTEEAQLQVMSQQTATPLTRHDEPKLGTIAPFRRSSWTRSRRKRCFDIAVATALLLPVAPLIPLIILLIKLDSPGPALYVHHRIGMGGAEFHMFKFRTMNTEKSGFNVSLTRAGDLRITRMGRLLRKWKVDEIPQLWNVIRGDMSIVGPRPHLRRLLGNSSQLRDFLSLRPGVTGAATVSFRHEEQILPKKIHDGDLEAYYIETILPKKMQLDVEYAAHATFGSDMKLLFSTMVEVLLRHGSWKTSSHPAAHHPIPINSGPRGDEDFSRRQDTLAG